MPDKNESSPTLHHRADVRQWRCMNCGQHIFTTVQDTPPDICAYCCDMTTWQVIEK